MTLDSLEVLLSQVQKPARYTGGEFGSIIKTPSCEMLRYAFCFPDIYEVGMSHLGMKILYSHANSREDVWCERVFAPDADMECVMREMNVPLYGLESLQPISEFDIIGFTLQYEMSFTAVLNMLELAGLPIHSAGRGENTPLVIAGGPCACNPEPLADFIDAFVLGEGEEVSDEIFDACIDAKKQKQSKTQLLERLAKIPGVYVPAFFDVSYNDDATIESVVPILPDIAKTVKKRVVKDLNSAFYPDSFVVPFLSIIHDRAVSEIFRGCIRGCRFCQAGYIYRPVREKTAETAAGQALTLLKNTGYQEVSLSSLSTSDYRELPCLLDRLLEETQHKKINISLPSLRIDTFSDELLEKVSKVRKSGLTFAPEAGTQRLRDIINKNITNEDILKACKIAFEGGYTAVKLYFMIGLPGETKQDIVGIASTAQSVVDLYYSMPQKPKGKSVSVSISVACFVPKPHTPFEFAAQDEMEALEDKQRLLLSSIRSKKISVSYHDAETSRLEAMLARGDRRLGRVIETAWRSGSRLDGWAEHFNPKLWHSALEEHRLSLNFYANRERQPDEVFPWDHLDYGVSKEYLLSEYQKALAGEVTPDCRRECSACGVQNQMWGDCQ
jgi:radical SAM family uncharacterized protein